MNCSDSQEAPTFISKNSLRRLRHLSLLSITFLSPIALTSFIWIEVWSGVASRAIDGSGHYAMGRIYDVSIFPDTFGWTNAYFAGMPFPNFYPPMFFWLISLLHHTQLVSYGTSFKLVMAIPLLLIPLSFCGVTWLHFRKDVHGAYAAAITSATFITIGEVFQPSSGLDVSSTILDGFYTQPLGFLLLLLWILVYLIGRQAWWQFTLATVLLAGTVLSNFFNAVTAVMFIAAVVITDLVKWDREINEEKRSSRRQILFLHLLSPGVALALTAFWLVPMASAYKFLVTRPIVQPVSTLATVPILFWYGLALVGTVLWFRSPKGRLSPFIITCIVLATALILSDVFAPRWFPLQSFRFFSTLNLMLSIPVGVAISRGVKWYLAKKRVGRDANSPKESISRRQWLVRHSAFALAAILVLGLVAFTMATRKLTQAFAFYTTDNFDRISGVLEFARSHSNGRYLVEVLPSRGDQGLIRADSLALNSYLGAQGNETTSIVYREASPNSIFFNAQLNAFSAYRESFGISSVLIDDLDFINQPLDRHLERLGFTGVRYLVIGSSETKRRLSETELLTRYNVGAWSVFELSDPPRAPIRALQNKPALVVGNFSVKLRRENEFDFIRLSEEQFSDAWFDVLLAYSQETRIDQLTNLDKFGALILDSYDSDDEDRAFNELKEFAQSRPLILLESQAALFARLKTSIADFPDAFIIDRSIDSPGEWVDAMQPSRSYETNSVRRIWRGIRCILEAKKLPTERADIWSHKEPSRIKIMVNGMPHGESVPTLISATFHPRWKRSDNKELYPVTPYFMLGFIDESTQLTFERSAHDRLALWVSLVSLVLLIPLSMICCRGHKTSECQS